MSNPSNVRQPRNTDSVNGVEALRCYYGPDRELTTNELKQLSSEERAELAQGICAQMGWTYSPPASK